eukprot:jgi/Botrbrau1/17248/Bobra.0015s0007.1
MQAELRSVTDDRLSPSPKMLGIRKRRGTSILDYICSLHSYVDKGILLYAALAEGSLRFEEILQGNKHNLRVAATLWDLSQHSTAPTVQQAFSFIFAATLQASESKSGMERDSAQSILRDIRSFWLHNGGILADSLPLLIACISSAAKHIVPKDRGWRYIHEEIRLLLEARGSAGTSERDNTVLRRLADEFAAVAGQDTITTLVQDLSTAEKCNWDVLAVFLEHLVALPHFRLHIHSMVRASQGRSLSPFSLL